MGTAQTGVLKSRYKLGLKNYVSGGHPLWELFRAVYQMTKKPFIVGGLALGSGYFLAAVRREERTISREMIAFPQARTDAAPAPAVWLRPARLECR